MEVLGIVLARSLQILRAPSGTVGYLPDLVQQLKARYAFLDAPKDRDLIPSDPPRGAEFRHGRLKLFDRTIVIDKFTIFNDGLVADSSSSTDDMDLFLNDLADWARNEIPKALPTGPRYYVSQIEVKLNQHLDSFAPRFWQVGQEITERLATYQIDAPRYEVTAVYLNFDQMGKPNPQPGAFSIDRRLNRPFSESTWFSQAPLKTNDHIDLLRRLDPN